MCLQTCDCLCWDLRLHPTALPAFPCYHNTLHNAVPQVQCCLCFGAGVGIVGKDVTCNESFVTHHTNAASTALTTSSTSCPAAAATIFLTSPVLLSAAAFTSACPSSSGVEGVVPMMVVLRWLSFALSLALVIASKIGGVRNKRCGVFLKRLQQIRLEI